MPITLKNRENADVIYTKRAQMGATSEFTSAGATLLSTSKLHLTINEKANVNRIVGKLSIPTVQDCPDQCKVPSVAYTETGSFDLSSVKFANVQQAEDFYAQFKSLVSSDAVRNMFLSGTTPA